MSSIHHALPLLLVLSATPACKVGSQPRPEPVDPPATAAPTAAPTDPGPPDVAPSQRPVLTVDQCKTQGGAIVGDIGDGATGRPEFRCPSGKPSMSRVRVGRDGGACCPAK